MSQKLQDPHHPAARRRTVRERLAAAAMVVLTLNITFLILFLLGWLVGWLHLSLGGQDADQRWRFQLTLNAGRIADDMQEAASSLRAASKVDTVIGNVVRHDSATQRITVLSEKGEQVTARINDATEVQVEGHGGAPSALQPGDRIELVFREQDGQNHAVRIAHLERK